MCEAEIRLGLYQDGSRSTNSGNPEPTPRRPIESKGNFTLCLLILDVFMTKFFLPHV